MKFSVLVPVYNVEKYLKFSIESVLSQSYKNFEIILVDDGSTDLSGQICDEYYNNYPNIIKVIHQKNQGQLASRCNAVTEATGDYCIFLDADDELRNNCLMLLSENIIKYNYADMYVYSFEYFNDDGMVLPCKYDWTNKKGEVAADKKQEIYNYFICGTQFDSLWTKAIKTEILKRDNTPYYKFYGKYMSEDLLQALYPVTYSKRIVFVGESLYLYRYNPNSVSNTFSLQTLTTKNYVHVYYLIKDYLKIWDMNDSEHISKLDANWLSQTIYWFDKYYINAKIKDRKKVMDFDWSSFVDESSLKNYRDNKYLSDNAKYLWDLIINKKYGRIKLYYIKKIAYKRVREIKRKFD